MDVHSVGKTETLEDIPLKYFVVVSYKWEGEAVETYTTKEAALAAYNNRGEISGNPVAIIRGVVIEGALE